MNEKTTIYLWHPNQTRHKKCGHLGIETKNIYVSFRPYDKPKEDKTQPFLYTFQDDINKEGRPPDVRYELTCLDVPFLEERFTLFARSDFEKTGIFDPNKQMVFWEQVLGLHQAKKTLGIDTLEKWIKCISGVKTVPVLNLIDYFVDQGIDNLEKEATYNWYSFAFSIIHTSGLIFYGKWKDSDKETIFGGLGLLLFPFLVSQVITGAGMPVFSFLYVRNRYLHFSHRRLSEADCETYLQNAMKEVPKGTIKRFTNEEEVIRKNFANYLKKFTPEQRMKIGLSYYRKLADSLSLVDEKKRSEILSEFDENSKNLILKLIEQTKEVTNQPKARL